MPNPSAKTLPDINKLFTTMNQLPLSELKEWAATLAEIKVTEDNKKIAFAKFEVDYLIRVKSKQSAILG